MEQTKLGEQLLKELGGVYADRAGRVRGTIQSLIPGLSVHEDICIPANKQMLARAGTST